MAQSLCVGVPWFNCGQGQKYFTATQRPAPTNPASGSKVVGTWSWSATRWEMVDLYLHSLMHLHGVSRTVYLNKEISNLVNSILCTHTHTHTHTNTHQTDWAIVNALDLYWGYLVWILAGSSFNLTGVFLWFSLVTLSRCWDSTCMPGLPHSRSFPFRQLTNTVCGLNADSIIK
jgi:hypothetical protein